MNVTQRIELSKKLGWSDLREVRVFGIPVLVLRGYRPFFNSGVCVSVRDDVPFTKKGIISLTNRNTPSKLLPQ